ncbi:MAG TPA: hypothetical protein IGS52_06350 [Oscillatoriaceae cyanobacterium M33_DOE_052]|uniref:Uncharacterized protein n=1 Tax=Planktothricoides sp. SpSt-374 TaxID=2282167 RepID=A0A7C3VHD7_9CYAN|nr:hypothetical protein [Oscillatoriaceae cyanobacterium M33_DOE_052]
MGFQKPTGEFWGLGGHGAIDISRFWCYLNVAVLLQGIIGDNLVVKLSFVVAQLLKSLGFMRNLDNAVPPTTGNLGAKKPGFCDNLGIKTEI